MKNWWILSTALLFLTGCYQVSQPEMDTYAQSTGLRAPTDYSYQSYNGRMVPQALPQQPVMQQPLQQPAAQQTTSQQPSLIQTIVIPQTPSMGYPMQQMPLQQTQAPLNAGIYPSWAYPVNDPVIQPKPVENMLILKRPGQAETVQCAIMDAMCIASYQQQGYIQVQAGPQFAGEKEVLSESDYPVTDTSGKWRDNNNIPRW